MLKLIALLLFTLPALAYDSFTVELGNDLFTDSQTDRYLTNTFNIKVRTEDLPDIVKTFLPDNEADHFITNYRHDIYTPSDLETRDSQPQDRPYAGHLFVEFKAIRNTKHYHSYTTLQVGIIGPAALAKEFQIGVHSLTGSKDANGWRHQLENEIGINLSKLYGHKANLYDDGLMRLDSISYFEAGLGNVKSYAKVGNKFLAGFNPPRDENVFGIDGVNLARQKSNFSAYVEVDLSGTYVARDIFIDGNTDAFGDRTQLTRQDYVTEVNASLVGRYKNYFLKYKRSRTSKQFHGQNGPHDIGTIIFEWRRSF